ncbi:hypothetical protein ABIA95_000145 [Bradyrhizobium sp. LA8.1]|uniref:hypothetical protein n=1 Tax=unclassified Bradyrhizobium TaxID=2631580 RepID=UPI00339A6BE0
MSALSEHYAGKECPGDFDEEDIANLRAFIWAAGADDETAHFVAKQLLKKGMRLVPYTPTEEMLKATGVLAQDYGQHVFTKIYWAMINAAPKA